MSITDVDAINIILTLLKNHAPNLLENFGVVFKDTTGRESGRPIIGGKRTKGKLTLQNFQDARSVICGEGAKWAYKMCDYLEWRGDGQHGGDTRIAIAKGKGQYRTPSHIDPSQTSAAHFHFYGGKTGSVDGGGEKGHFGHGGEIRWNPDQDDGGRSYGEIIRTLRIDWNQPDAAIATELSNVVKFFADCKSYKLAGHGLDEQYKSDLNVMFKYVTYCLLIQIVKFMMNDDEGKDRLINILKLLVTKNRPFATKEQGMLTDEYLADDAKNFANLIRIITVRGLYHPMAAGSNKRMGHLVDELEGKGGETGVGAGLPAQLKDTSAINILENLSDSPDNIGIDLLENILTNILNMTPNQFFLFEKKFLEDLKNKKETQPRRRSMKAMDTLLFDIYNNILDLPDQRDADDGETLSTFLEAAKQPDTAEVILKKDTFFNCEILREAIKQEKDKRGVRYWRDAAEIVYKLLKGKLERRIKKAFDRIKTVLPDRIARNRNNVSKESKPTFNHTKKIKNTFFKETAHKDSNTHMKKMSEVFVVNRIEEAFSAMVFVQLRQTIAACVNEIIREEKERRRRKAQENENAGELSESNSEKKANPNNNKSRNNGGVSESRGNTTGRWAETTTSTVPSLKHTHDSQNANTSKGSTRTNNKTMSATAQEWSPHSMATQVPVVVEGLPWGHFAERFYDYLGSHWLPAPAEEIVYWYWQTYYGDVTAALEAYQQQIQQQIQQQQQMYGFGGSGHGGSGSGFGGSGHGGSDFSHPSHSSMTGRKGGKRTRKRKKHTNKKRRKKHTIKKRHKKKKHKKKRTIKKRHKKRKHKKRTRKH